MEGCDSSRVGWAVAPAEGNSAAGVVPHPPKRRVAMRVGASAANATDRAAARPAAFVVVDA